MGVTRSRYTVCADNLGKVIEGLEEAREQMVYSNTPQPVIDKVDGQIEFLRLQQMEVLDLWQSILTVLNETNDGGYYAVTSSRPTVQ